MGMLVLGRRPMFRGTQRVADDELMRRLAAVGHGVRIGPDVCVHVLRIDPGGLVRLGITAPPNVRIVRDELPVHTPRRRARP